MGRLTELFSRAPHLGYRNMDKRPIDTVNLYLSVTKEAS